MGLGRVELPTSRLSGVRSNHLSYRPDGVRLGKMIRRGGTAAGSKEAAPAAFLSAPDGGPDANDLRQKAYRRKDFESRKSQRDFNITLRKVVIQPQVLLRLPCYDFTPITSHTLDGYLLAVESPASSTRGFRDVTGGVYKARERIHRCLLISHY